MRKTREILRLNWLLHQSHREIARVIGVGVGSPTQAVARAKGAGITCWADVEALSDEELDARMYPPPMLSGAVRPEPNPAVIHLELRRTGVTSRLLHERSTSQRIPSARTATRSLRLLEQRNIVRDKIPLLPLRGGNSAVHDFVGSRQEVRDTLAIAHRRRGQQAVKLRSDGELRTLIDHTGSAPHLTTRVGRVP